MNQTESDGEYEYSQFVYFVDIPADLPQHKQVHEPEPEHKSIVTRVV